MGEVKVCAFAAIGLICVAVIEGCMGVDPDSFMVETKTPVTKNELMFDTQAHTFVIWHSPICICKEVGYAH